MQALAFAAPAGLSARKNNASLHAVRCPLMTVSVPRPLSDTPPIPAFRYAQSVSETVYPPPFNSFLEPSSTSVAFSPTPEFASLAVRTAFANANIFEDEMHALQPLLTRLLTTGDVRQFLREALASPSFAARYFDRMSNMRVAEVVIKVALGRAPLSHDEVRAGASLLCAQGLQAFVDSVVDSAEYEMRFGKSALPQVGAVGLPSAYPGGTAAFTALAKATLMTRGATTDSVATTPQTGYLLAAGGRAGVVDIATGYDTLVPRYSTAAWMALPASSLATDWASMSHVLSPAAVNWPGLSNRPTGTTDVEWSPSWKPTTTSEKWKPGFFFGKRKSYV